MESSRKVSSRPKPLSILRSLEEKYVAAMKKLQFGEYFVLLEKFCFYTLFGVTVREGVHISQRVTL